MKVSSLLLLLSLALSVTLAGAADKAPLLEKGTCGAVAYPRAALLNEESGTVSIAVLVSPDAKVVEVKLEKSSGSKSLDKAATSLYSTCKYVPGQKDGKPEQSWAKIEHTWTLS
jgi:protein TonB